MLQSLRNRVVQLFSPAPRRTHALVQSVEEEEHQEDNAEDAALDKASADDSADDTADDTAEYTTDDATDDTADEDFRPKTKLPRGTRASKAAKSHPGKSVRNKEEKAAEDIKATATGLSPKARGKRRANSSDDDRPRHKIPKIRRSEAENLLIEDPSLEAGRARPLKHGHEDWTSDEISMFNKLNERGLHPLLNVTWQIDFPTLPNNMFTKTSDAGGTFIITNIHGPEFRGTKALVTLFDCGVRARGRIEGNLRPEPSIHKYITNFIKWSETDGDLRHRDYIPVLVVNSVREDETIQDVVQRTQTDLHELGRRWRESLVIDDDNLPDDEDEEPTYSQQPPTLYALVVTHTVVSLVSHDSSVVDKAIRTIATFDFGADGQDVWNALAIGIVVCWCRNFLIDFDPPALPKVPSPDPDA